MKAHLPFRKTQNGALVCKLCYSKSPLKYEDTIPLSNTLTPNKFCYFCGLGVHDITKTTEFGDATSLEL